jgi:hypothetical protein
MKKILVLIILLIVPVFIFAQVELPGALGMTFGINKVTVKTIISNKGGVPNGTGSNPNVLSFTKVKMGTKICDNVSCKFIDDKLYKIIIAFFPEVEAKTQELYDYIRSIIVDKYGETKSYRDFKGIYTDGDGYEMQAVRTGNADIVSYWTDFKNENAITLEIKAIEDFVYVSLSYEDGILIKEAIKREEAKNATEF